ncbi:MAG: diaminopropionate ammonia-lyase, partial [Proteobacteria bacterium]|nr:diaminopropionate ammonia-lyase [Pseudomonadota bacterium]
MPLSPILSSTLGRAGRNVVGSYLRACPAHKPTPLFALRGLARSLGVLSLHVKDESYRLGLGSFKALGGAYAVVRLVIEEAERRLGRPLSAAEILRDEVRMIAQTMTMGCATDGDHGRSVAAGARLAGCAAVIFVHEGVSDDRVAAICCHGARVERVSGSYDDAIAAAAEACARNGWTIVSDTSWKGGERIPLLVMQGYTVAISEALDTLERWPTHIFLQAGVGGFAAAVAAYVADQASFNRPHIIVVEPELAACVMAGAKSGAPVRICREKPTVMSMLECYEASPIALHVLQRLADAFLAIGDEMAVGAMYMLAHPIPGDPAVVAGESGGAGLAGLLAAMEDPAVRGRLALDDRSR